METIYDESLPVLERIQAPMVWERLEDGIRVQDLQPDRYDEALQFAKDFFIEDDPMCVGCNLNKDEESVEEFLELIQFWMQDTQSFLAVDGATEEAVGLLVGRVNDSWSHTKTMSRVRIHKAEVLGKMQRFQSHIHKQVNLFEQYKTEAFYKVYVWCVARDYRNRGIGRALIRSAIQQTRRFNMPVVMGVFTGAVSQHIASAMGFVGLVEILYWQWKEGEEPVFDDPGAGNNSAELMVFVIEENLAHSEKEEEEEKEESAVEKEEVEPEESEQDIESEK